jgi:hypothetical protein
VRFSGVAPSRGASDALKSAHGAEDILLLRDIYQKSTQNLIRAMDFRKSAGQTVRIYIYDNSARFAADKLLPQNPGNHDGAARADDAPRRFSPLVAQRQLQRNQIRSFLC